LDRRQSSDQFFLDDVLRDRAQLSWEHLFSLLALILPREPLKIAFQALHTDDDFCEGSRSNIWTVFCRLPSAALRPFSNRFHFLPPMWGSLAAIAGRPPQRLPETGKTLQMAETPPD